MRVVGSLATKFAPPFSLVLHYFVSGTVFSILAMLMLFLFKDSFEPPFDAFVYASFVHFFLLGFVMMIIFGALYQLIPVALEIPVFSFKIGYVQFYLYLIGILILTASMYFSDFFSFMPIGAFLVYSSMFLFVVNFFISLRNLEKFDITSRFLVSAVVSLTIGITIGLFLALNFVYGFYSGKTASLLLSHITFTLFGFVFNVIMGVSMVLLPMFSLAHKFNDVYIKIAYWVINLSVFVGGIGFIVLDNPLLKIGVFTGIFVSFVFYLLQVLEIYRRRPRKVPDIGMDTMFYSHLFLLIVVALSLGILFDERFVFFTALSLFLGFLTVLIYGSLYKIIPFLTWFHRFSNLVGKKKVPMLADMLPKKIPDVQVGVYVFGVVLFIVGVFVKNSILTSLGVGLMFIGSLIFAYIVYYILSFKVEE